MTLFLQSEVFIPYKEKRLDTRAKIQYNYTILKTSRTFIFTKNAAPKMLPQNYFFRTRNRIKNAIIPYSNWVYSTYQKVTKKRKKLPFGNFLEQKTRSWYTPKQWMNQPRKKSNRVGNYSEKKRKLRHIPACHLASARHM